MSYCVCSFDSYSLLFIARLFRFVIQANTRHILWNSISLQLPCHMQNCYQVLWLFSFRATHIPTRFGLSAHKRLQSAPYALFNGDVLKLLWFKIKCYYPGMKTNLKNLDQKFIFLWIIIYRAYAAKRANKEILTININLLSPWSPGYRHNVTVETT